METQVKIFGPEYPQNVKYFLMIIKKEYPRGTGAPISFIKDNQYLITQGVTCIIEFLKEQIGYEPEGTDEAEDLSRLRHCISDSHSIYYDVIVRDTSAYFMYMKKYEVIGDDKHLGLPFVS